jgi:D-alanine-D-alanine ligase
MNHNHVPHFMETILMSGLRKGYFYKACLLNLNMSYGKMILKILDNGLSHSLLGERLIYRDKAS